MQSQHSLPQSHSAVSALPIDDTRIDTWFERDRAHVALVDVRTDRPIVEWWDDEVSQAIEDGFLDGGAFILGRLTRPNRLHESAYEFAANIGLLPAAESEAS